jgi:deoxyribose-phosphate aldolase
VKASGSIKSVAQARELLGAGAALLGTSAGIAIVSDRADGATAGY